MNSVFIIIIIILCWFSFILLEHKTQFALCVLVDISMLHLHTADYNWVIWGQSVGGAWQFL